MNPKEQARQILTAAQEAAERKLEQAVNRLPAQLAKHPGKEQEFIYGKLDELRNWQAKNYFLPFDLEKLTTAQHLAFVGELLLDMRKGFSVRFQNSEHARIMLTEGIFVARYANYLVGLLLEKMQDWPEVQHLVEAHFSTFPKGLLRHTDKLVVFGKCLTEKQRLDKASLASPETLAAAIKNRIGELKHYLAYHEQRYLAEARTAAGENTQAGAFAFAKFQYGTVIAYLESLLLGPQEAPEGPKDEEGGLDFDSLFAKPENAQLVIQAMQEAEPAPLLNEAGKPIAGVKVAPLIALADTLEAKALLREGVGSLQAYRAICRHFGFQASTRPEKARSEGAGTYKDYLKGFEFFFINNKPQ